MSEKTPAPDEIVHVRNKINGVAIDLPYSAAKDQIDHPLFGEHYEIVRSGKPEVLADRSPKPDKDAK